MTEPPRITDSAVRLLAGPRLYERAALNLGLGKIVERTLYTDGVLTGKWDAHPGAPLSAVLPADEEVMLDCTCDDILTQAVCEHAATLALAWARSPHTFTRVSHDSAVDEMLDDYQGVNDDGDEAEADVFYGEQGTLAPFAAQTRGQPSPSPVSERVTSTLTLQLPSLTEEYRALLSGFTLSQLRDLASQRGVKASGAKREPILAALAEALGQPRALSEPWRQLSAAARLALGLTPFLSTDMGVHQQHLRQTLQAFDAKAAQQFEAAVEDLKRSGLLFDRYGYLAIPAGLHHYFPPDAEFVRPLSEARGLRETAAPGPLEFPAFMLQLLLAVKAQGAELKLRAEALHPLQIQFAQLRGWPVVPAELDAAARERNPLDALYRQHLTLPPAPPLLTEASARALRRALEAPAERLEFGLRLLSKMGLVSLTRGQPLAVREEGFTQYISHHLVEHLMPLLNAWMNLHDWSEMDLLLARQTNLRLWRQGMIGIPYSDFVAALSGSRVHLIQLLRRAPAGTWIDLAGLVARARALNLLHGMTSIPGGVGLEQNGRALNLVQANDWQAFYAPLVQVFLTGPLHWMGLVDLGYRQNELVSARLTDLGAFLLYQKDTYTAPPMARQAHALTYATDGALVLQPAAAEPRLLSLLSLLGDVEAGPKGTLAYRVSVAGAARAFEAGSDPDGIATMLQSGAGAPPPGALVTRLRQWWDHFGDAHLYRDLALMELADDYALTELLASTTLAQYLLYRFSPRLIALRPEGVEALREQLVNKGYTPKIAAAG